MSSFDSGGKNDDNTFTDNRVSSGTDQITDDKVSEDSENIRVNHNEDTCKYSENINKEVMKNKVSNVVKTSDNYYGEIIMNNNHVMNYKVSGGVKISNEEILLKKK